ncbi:hypothetical protein AB0F30_16910 [Streptomyces sp. NPDC029006]|uniref:hypothetical protein n=1 Tax=Streptomyces sp. NPDC029006 TaxID=3155467 RepID=UPI0033D0582D
MPTATATPEGRQARILTAALRNWAALDTTHAPTAARIQIRQPPTWEYAGTINITSDQTNRLLGLIRDDVTTHTPHPTSPEQAATAIQALLTERRAAGHTTIHARDLIEAATRIGRPRAWIADHLNHLADTGQIAETWRPSVFRIA